MSEGGGQSPALKYIGVRWKHRKKKFSAHIHIGNRTKVVGSYSDERTAAIAREKVLIATKLGGARNFGPTGHFSHDNVQSMMQDINVEGAVHRIRAAKKSRSASRDSRTAVQLREAPDEQDAGNNAVVEGPTDAKFMITGVTQEGYPEPGPFVIMHIGHIQMMISQSLMANRAALAAIGDALVEASMQPGTPLR